MTNNQMLHDEIQQALAQAEEVFARYPERRLDIAQQYIQRGELRPHPVLYLARMTDIEAGEHLRQPIPDATSPEERLLRQLRGFAQGPTLLNPIQPVIGLGRGTGTLPASFGITLDAELGYAPRGCRSLDEVLAEGMPDPQNSGLLPEMRRDIEAIQQLTPPWVKIAFPDMQGPFNIAHMVLGDEVFYAPYDDPEKFRAYFELITDFFIAVHQQLSVWITPERRVQFPTDACRLAECSVNMLSAEFYLEHVLAHDQRIAEYYGQLAVHPCSGPHVFYATLQHLPHVVYTEAGYIEKTCAGAISVEAALAEIGDRPIILSIGEELPEDWDEAERRMQRYFDYALKHPQILFGFTGMYWKKGSEEQIIALHRRLDDYWHNHIWLEKRENHEISSEM